MNQLISTKELAKRLEVAEITITKWREKGLPFIKLGRAVRFDLEEVSTWIESQNKGDR